ncbi:MAG: hypothetical protein RLZZ341_1818, partial [Pseudomonadota bacterium]
VYQVRDAMAAGRPAVQSAPEPEVPADLDPLNTAADRGRRTEDPPL